MLRLLKPSNLDQCDVRRKTGGYKEGVERYMLIGPRSEGIDPFIEKTDTSLNKDKGVSTLQLIN